MTLHVSGNLNIPNAVCLSTDVSAGKIAGTNPGMTIFFSDTKVWKIVKDDLTLNDYTAPTDATAEYSKQTQSSKRFDIVKGALNKLRLRPHIQNEHVESSRENMSTITSAILAGQFFKASQDNINGISLTLQSAATFASMDAIAAGGGENKAGTFEYGSDGALQAEYIKSGATEGVRSAFTDVALVTQDGSYAGKFSGTTATDSWTVTLDSTNLTGVTFSLKFAQTSFFAQQKVYFFIGDGTNTKSFPLTVLSNNLWQTFQFPETAMSVLAEDLTGTTPVMTTITKMGFRVDDSQNGSFFYTDSITYQAEGGSVDLELWDFGVTLPTGDGTEDYTAVGTQNTALGDLGIGGFVVSSINLPLLGGKRKYHVDSFITGVALEIPSNVVLTVGNYYGIVIKYVDTNVSVFGADTTFATNYYSSGYAWKAELADDLIDKIDGATGSGAYSDLMFQVFSTQDVYVTSSQLIADAAPSEHGNVSIFVEDSNMEITDIPITNQRGGFLSTSLDVDLSERPSFMDEGGKFEAYYNDDAGDVTLEHIFFGMTYYYIPPITNC